MNIKSGLDYILEHFEDDFPRTISTYKTKNAQIITNSKEEVLRYFSDSNFKDCRISAFNEIEKTLQKPNLIFVDLDDKSALHESLALFYKTISGIPTVINTGNGFAIIQPIQMRSWNDKEIVTYKKKTANELSKLFLYWAERYLTNNKCDSGNHPSLKNTMIRVPGSYNSKLLAQGESLEYSKVSVVCEWNHQRPEVKNLPFKKYVDKTIKEENKLAKIDRKGNPENYQWIAELLKYNIEDGRARLLFDVTRYLINLQGHSIEEAADKINSWLNTRYYSKSMIKSECKRALKDGKYPRRIGTIKNTDQQLYEIIPEGIKH